MNCLIHACIVCIIYEEFNLEKYLLSDVFILKEMLTFVALLSVLMKKEIPM